MSPDAHRETIERWVGDYLDTSAFLDHPSLLREYAPEVLTTFLSAACRVRGVAPGDVEAPDVKPALVDEVGRLEIPGSVREGIPRLVGAFLAEMEAQGRLAGGRTLGLQARALGPAYLDAAAGRLRPYRAPAAKVGRNDPCPCGSGLKYKKCCMGRLGS